MKWKLPPQTSPLWIRPSEKPTEYAYEVRSIPPRPGGLKTVLAWDLKAWPSDVPAEPEKVLYLGALEWTWSPSHSRFDSYYLAFTDEVWVIYLHEFSDGCGGTWDWYPYSTSLRVDADVYALAFWMIYDLLKADSGIHELDRFHLVSAQGLLSVGDFKNIGDLVWVESEEEKDETL